MPVLLWCCAHAEPADLSCEQCRLTASPRRSAAVTAGSTAGGYVLGTDYALGPGQTIGWYNYYNLYDGLRTAPSFDVYTGISDENALLSIALNGTYDDVIGFEVFSVTGTLGFQSQNLTFWLLTSPNTSSSSSGVVTDLASMTAVKCSGNVYLGPWVPNVVLCPRLPGVVGVRYGRAVDTARPAPVKDGRVTPRADTWMSLAELRVLRGAWMLVCVCVHWHLPQCAPSSML